MQIVLSDRHELLNQTATGKTEAKVVAALSRFGDNIKSVELTVEDLNGPRGGLDQECQTVVRLRKMDDVRVAIRNRSLSKAISLCINRVERAVGRRIDRRSLSNVSPRAPGGRDPRQRDNPGFAM